MRKIMRLVIVLHFFISSLIIGCLFSIKIDQAFLLSRRPPPSSASANHCGEIINTSRWGNNKHVTLGKKPEYIDTKFEKSLFN